MKSKLVFLRVDSNPANIHLDEGVLKKSWRRLSSSSSEDVFKTNIFILLIRLRKTSWSRPIYSSCSYVFNTSSRRLHQDKYIHLTHVFRRRLEQDQYIRLVILLQDVLLRRFQDFFKTSCKNVFKSFSRRLIKLNCSCLHVLKMSSRHIQNVSETYSKVGYL